MMFHRFDLHTHSIASDGTCTPTQVVQQAVAEGMHMLALCDHDNMNGILEASAEAERQGIVFLPSVEMETEFPEELHILGLDVDPNNTALREALERCARLRDQRNGMILDLLAGIGCDVRAFLDTTPGTITRKHIAFALRDAGFAKNTADALGRYLRPGCPAYAEVPRFTKKEVIELILGAGGIPVLAHPCQLKCEVAPLVRELVSYGLQGIEAYYSEATLKQVDAHITLAKEHGLLVTSGSDFHGNYRPGTAIGCAYQPVAALETCYQFFLERQNRV